MDRSSKEQLKTAVAEQFRKSNAVIVAEYRGLTVSEMTDLRVKLRESTAEFMVLKNRVAKKAVEEDGLESLKDFSNSFVGPVGVVCAFGDSAQATKTILEFAKEHPKLIIKSGHMDGSTVNVEELKAIADLPSKEVLLGQIVGSLVSPHRGLLGVLNGVSRNLVQVINAIKETKS
ncbi:MAG: 50S ribosomal protein L10 [Pseudobacteriovorax sp.]|nr:50S ribosomal protein L10 [Pseudobacteriovorax sp.]